MNHKGTVKIETERLILRKAIPEDIEPMFHNWANDERVTKFMTWQPHSDISVTAQYNKYLTDNYSRDDFYDWIIELKSLGEPIGSISAVQIREDISEAEIGYCLGYSWWRQGIMTEAFSAVIKFLFEEVGFNRIMATHDVNNPNSGAVMRKCGLTYEGTLRQAGKNNQGIADISIYSILRSEYEERLGKGF